MKRVISLIITISMLPILLTACYTPAVENSVLYSGRGDLYVPFAYSMPLDGGHYTRHARKLLAIQILETDSYGRTLCSLSFHDYPSVFWGNGEAYCIVQTSSDKETRFYEDKCCAGVTRPEESDPVIAQLKRDNDWDLPFNDAKMTTLPYQGLDPVGVYAIQDSDESFERAALEYLNLDSYGCYFEFVCRDAYGRTMVSLHYPKKNEVYFVLMRDGNVLDCPTAAHRIVNMASPWEEIHELKQANQWNLP